MWKTLIHIVSIAAICIIVSTYTLYDWASPPEWRADFGPSPQADDNNIFWFVQVSDIHLSRYLDPLRAVEFEIFCNNTLGTIKPDLVLVTGDLTDAKTRNRLDSIQYEDEWKTYSRIIVKTDVLQKYIWLDIRGNHDAFDVLTVDDPNLNPYLKYSGDKGQLSSKVYHHKKSFGTYSFIPVDATMIPGPRRPFNFMGYLSQERMKKLEKFSEETTLSNFTFWYSHYPTPTITSPIPGLRSLIGQRGGVYLAGHLHALGGLKHKLYVINPKGQGFLELELADWMENRVFRIVALDHDLMSFTDIKHGEWPAIVLTNPKEAKMMMPTIEPIGRMKNSSHIRFLVFNPWKIIKASVSIDGMLLDETTYNIPGSPLWVCRWEADSYSNGMHDINIAVIDINGNKKNISEQFSLDISWKANFDIFAGFVLLTDFSSLILYGFYFVTFAYVAVIIFLGLHRYDYTKDSMFNKLCMLMANRSFSIVVLLFAINLIWGPWFVGELIRGNVGICFSYGLLINGELVPERMLYLEGVIKITVLYFPSLLFLAQFTSTCNTNVRSTVKWKSKALLFIYVMYILLQFYTCLRIYRSYGLMAVVVCPCQTWWLIFILYKTCNIYRLKWKSNSHL